MLSQNSLNLSKARIDSAKEDLQTSVDLFNIQRYKAANNRAYYAVFHAIRSVLASFRESG